MSHNWDDYGITWSEETVKRQNGDNATDKAAIRGTAQIPVVNDLDKFVAHFGASVVLGIMDGTSIRVMAQDVNRRMLAKGSNVEAIREAVYNRLRGVRNAGVPTVKTVKVYILPGGAEWKGTDLTEYKAATIAALVDLGVPVETAQQKVQDLSL
jgi:hypothetical protein